MPKAEDLAQLTGYKNDSTETELKRRNCHSTKGDWRKYRMIHNLKVKECVRTWSAGNLVIDPFNVVSIVPVGMECYAEKIHSASCRDVDFLPSYVKNIFH